MRYRLILFVIVLLIMISIASGYVILLRYDFNRLKPQLIEMTRSATGRELTLGGDVQFRIGLTPALVVEDVSLQNAPWGSRPEMARLKRIELQVALLPLISKRVEVQRLVLVAPDILIETDKSGRSNLPIMAEKPPGGPGKDVPAVEDEAGQMRLSFHQVRIRNGQIAFKDGKSGEVHSLVLQDLSAYGRKGDGPVEVTIKGSYNEKKFDVQATIAPFAAVMGSREPLEIKAAVRAGGATFTVEGAIEDLANMKGIACSARLEGQSIEDLIRYAGGEVSFKGPFEVSGHVTDTEAGIYRISDLKAGLEGIDLAASVDVDLRAVRPNVSAVVSAEKLDLRPLFPKKPDYKSIERDAAGTAAGRSRVFSDEPLELDALRALDGHLQLKAKRLMLQGAVLDDASADMAIVDGGFMVNPVKAALFGGRFEAKLDLKPKGTAYTVRSVVQVDGLDLGSMAKYLEFKHTVDGRLNAELDVKGFGKSVSTIMAGLNGKTIVHAREGRIDNRYVDLLGADLSASALRLLNPVREKRASSKINCLVSRFDIQGGVARSTVLVLDGEHMVVVGDGIVNLKTEGLDIHFKPTPKEGAGVDGVGKLSLSLGELAKQFKLSGTLANPRIMIDPTQTAKMIGKAVAAGALLGPVGLAAPFINRSEGDQDICALATDAAQKGVRMTAAEAPAKEKEPLGRVTDTVKEGAKSLGGKIKSLFGN